MIRTSSAPSPSAEATSISQASSPTLSSLKRVDMSPEWRSANTPTKMLQNIEYVEVTKATHQEDSAGKNQVYTISVYMTHSETKAKLHKEKREPDFQVPHSISQFCSLRNNVHACVQRGHKGTRCVFCEQLARFVTFGQGESLSFAAMAFSPKTNGSALLSGFLSEAIRQSQRGLETLQTSGCRGQHQLPRLLQAFIFQSPQH